MSTVSKRTPFFTTFGICFAPFLETPKKAHKNQHKCYMLRLWRPNDPNVIPRARQKETKIHQKSTQNRLCAAVGVHRRLLTSKSGPGGGTPSQNTPKIIKQNYNKKHNLDHYLSHLSHVDRLDPFCMTFGSCFRSLFRGAQNNKKKHRHKRSIWRLWRPNDPHSDPRG